jgi:flagellar biosynthesis/type III secretory pathway protein FliH
MNTISAAEMIAQEFDWFYKEVKFKDIELSEELKSLLYILEGDTITNATSDHCTEWQEAWDAGHEEGYDLGYEEGYDSGHEEGYDSGHDSGYEKGYDSGYEVGHDSGYVEGYDAAEMIYYKDS